VARATSFWHSRRAIPPTSAESLNSLAALSGAEIDIVSVDLATPRAPRLRGEYRAGQRPVGGIIHAAGVFEDGLILNQDWTRFSSVLGAKASAPGMHRAFAIRDLDYLILLLVGGRASRPGQDLSNYVAATHFWRLIAERARRQGVPATCIAWGGWSGLGMAGASKQRWLERWRERG